MVAHQIRITVPESHEITVRLPADFPSGEAEMVVWVAVRPPAPAELGTMAAGSVSDAFRRRFPRAGGLGPVIFLDDPTAPLDEADWGGDHP